MGHPVTLAAPRGAGPGHNHGSGAPAEGAEHLWAVLSHSKAQTLLLLYK